MSNSEQQAPSQLTSYDLHHYGCFAYLKNVRIPSFDWNTAFRLDSSEKELLSAIQKIKSEKKPRDDCEYPDLFKKFNLFCEIKIASYIDSITKKQDTIQVELDSCVLEIKTHKRNETTNSDVYLKLIASQTELSRQLNLINQRIQELDDFVISFFINDNKHLNYNYDAIKKTIQKHNPSSQSLEKSILDVLDDSFTNLTKNTLSPSQVGSKPILLANVLSDNFKPGHDTSIKSVIHTNWNQNEGRPKLLRTGTLAQRHEGEPRVDPMFVHYLKAQERLLSPNDTRSKRITHLVINLLGRDRTGIEGDKEKALTQQLEDLEETHSNCAVITLPADQGLMDSEAFKDTTNYCHFGLDAKREFASIANETSGNEIKDFHISKRIREILFTDQEGNHTQTVQESIINELIDKSFIAVGVNQNDWITPAQKQAVWFHFIKFELTNYIVTTLDPDTFNIDCKDGIDRGAAHRAYFNLIKNIEQKCPMSQDDFQASVHAAAAGIKGRGMNHHRNLMWNTVDAYVNANYQSIQSDEDQSWMIPWRDLNCPHERVGGLLKKHLTELKEELIVAQLRTLQTTPIKEQRITNAITLLDKIDLIKETSGKRLLLEAALQIKALALNPSEESASRCDTLADEIAVEYPTLTLIAGSIKEFTGKIMLALSFSDSMSRYATDTIKEGTATREKGENATARNELQTKMKNFLLEVKATESGSDEKIEHTENVREVERKSI